MTQYRTFERTWWKDAKCTIPGPGRKHYDHRIFETETDAQRACCADNAQRAGCYRHGADDQGRKVRELVRDRGPRGLATEYESVLESAWR